MSPAALKSFRVAYNVMCERVEGMPDDGIADSQVYHEMCDVIEALSLLAFEDVQ